MAQRGKPSVAHEFDKRDCCVHCSMYRVNVERMNHACKQTRENASDEIEAAKLGITADQYRRGDLSPTI